MTKPNSHKAIFIDKDGTLIPDIPYNVDASLITLMDDAAKGLQQLQQAGFLLIVITNQSGVARGLFREEALKDVRDKVALLFKENDLTLDGFYFCPHHPEGVIEQYAYQCDCRKPQPGLILRAATDFNVDVTQSWMIGDFIKDVEAGKKAGCKTVWITNKNNFKLAPESTPDFIAKNITEAAKKILQSA